MFAQLGFLFLILGFAVSFLGAIYFWLFVAFGGGLLGKNRDKETAYKKNNRILMAMLILFALGAVFLMAAKYTGQLKTGQSQN